MHCDRPNSSGMGRWLCTTLHSIASAYLAANFVDSCEKMFRTDFCNRLTIRAPADRSIPERSAFAEPAECGAEWDSEPQCDAGPPCGCPALGGQAVDAAVQLWASHTQLYLKKGESSTAPGDAALPWRYRPRARLCELTSNVPCHIPRIFGDPNDAKHQSRFFRPFVKEDDLASSERLPPTSAPEGTRHCARGLATAGSASDALSL